MMKENGFIDVQLEDFVQGTDRPCFILNEKGALVYSNVLTELLLKNHLLSVDYLHGMIPADGEVISTIRVGESYDALVRKIIISGTTLFHVVLHNLLESRGVLNIDDNMESVINSLQEGVYITDGEGFTKKINNAYTELTGLSRQDLEGKHVAELLSFGVFDSSMTVRVMKSRTRFSNMQKINNNKICLVTGVPVFDENNNLIAVINSAYDLTEMNRLQEDVKKSEISLKRKDIEIDRLRARVGQSHSSSTRSAIMKSVYKISEKLADSDVSVLLLGSTGTGKSTMAYSIHKNSQRAKEAFIEVNCGAVPESLFESELFGYVKGAFTGASDRGKVGLIESADKGTLFLDEIGDMPIHLQVKLLTFLQTGKIRRLGETNDRKINVRIISATNKDPVKLIEAGMLREDLFYRLSLVSLTLPDLKERKEDVFFLAKDILGAVNERYGKAVEMSKEVFLFLESYDWPGNLRELEHVIEQMVVLLDGSVIGVDSLPDKIFSPSVLKPTEIPIELNLTLQDYMDIHEKEFLSMAIKSEQDTGKLSSKLGIHRTTLARKLKYHGIK
ncbi:sigma-54 interaction domain-containing protein [Oceanisphaera psychrotolerans]|uniref:Sigma-54-dependent Fis family transcriptional regulator n=1 Tax=Oceanisphaera psychrotolerans TaxID=1414654 RepID=A0A1J4QJZ6_9GAMM|nr:sigma 54-interacting transcriptional regulator [Oceanisphaera psychrotolerans]OIN14286.1 hypothetical protein BFR47_08315 [Oceanisphaera psychrotolerans]